MNKTQILKIVLSIISCVVLDILLHALTSGLSTIPEDAVLSEVSRVLGVEGAASLWALAAFSGVALVFLVLRKDIPGKGIQKGINYGASVALLWMMGMLEGVSLFGNPMIREFVVGCSDAIPAFVLSILISTIVPKKTENPSRVLVQSPHRIWILLTFMILFTLVRYGGYSTGMLRSGMQERPWITLIWTFLMGLTTGVGFLLITSPRDGTPFSEDGKRGAGFLLFGINWVSFLFFMPLMFSGYLGDVLLRIGIDLMAVVLAMTFSRAVRLVLPKRRRKRKTINGSPRTVEEKEKRLERRDNWADGSPAAPVVGNHQ